jgi:predicted AAA+ superfamily ATPase
MESIVMAENKTIEEIKEGLTRLQDTRIYLEVTPSTVRRAIAKTYQPELIKKYYIEELTPTKEGGFIVKFTKRFQPLTEEEYQKEYWNKDGE